MAIQTGSSTEDFQPECDVTIFKQANTFFFFMILCDALTFLVEMLLIYHEDD